MVEKPFELVWTSLSQKDLLAIYNYISANSPQNAKMVINEIITRTERTIDHSDIFGPDKYKMNNDGSYRAFEIHKFRISYRVTGNIIRVLRIRHTKMDPKTY